MRLPSCWSCQYRFKWKELLFKFRKIECPSCREHQHVTRRKQRQTQVLTLFLTMLTIVGIHFIYSYSAIGALLYGVAILLITLVFSPFLSEFTEKEEQLFK
ncbi:TIGR04104 family putative zinc finger protein [Evansella cellulosilytica]|uniref:CXXC-20-CXXC protein n=1 Tax=Evansella cellulosilytica (strain ATCC 21833 / DSM 2522 / FERM P-1141 / JCM 9156 / N-4) TaxID=649639 RepID=E6TSL2_EVAC2|nr:TIGR04104 family putative zinc finger protein [Evansella cellulosilytica]ADU29520.1 hypothetical protein Bcell_1255 [Evansella cellulosilytica DSM 2522]